MRLQDPIYLENRLQTHPLSHHRLARQLRERQIHDTTPPDLGLCLLIEACRS